MILECNRLVDESMKSDLRTTGGGGGINNIRCCTNHLFVNLFKASLNASELFISDFAQICSHDASDPTN